MQNPAKVLYVVYSKFKNRRSDGVLKHSAVYLFFFVGVTILNILLRKYFAIELSIPAFGIFTAIIALHNMLLTPIQVFPMVLIRRISWLFKKEGPGAAFSYHLSFSRFFSRIYVGYILVLLLFIPLFQSHYHLSSNLPLIFLIYILLFFALNNLMLPVLQAKQRFATVGTINILTALFKIVFAVFVVTFAVQFGFTRPGIYSRLLLPDIPFFNFYNLMFSTVFSLGAFIFGAFFTLLISTFLVFKLRRPYLAEIKTKPLELKQLWHDVWPIFAIFVVFGIFRNIDEYFARHFLSEQKNGLYGALVSVGKSSLFLVSTIIFVLYPKLSSNIDDIKSSARILFKGLTLAVTGGLCGIVIISLFPELVITVLTSSKYVGAAAMLKWFFLSYLPYAILFVIVQFFIVHRDTRFSIGLLFFTLTGITLFQFFHANPMQIITVMGTTGYSALIYAILYFYIKYRKSIKSV